MLKNWGSGHHAKFPLQPRSILLDLPGGGSMAKSQSPASSIMMSI